MPPRREGFYGLLAEFNTPSEVGSCHGWRRPFGLSTHGVLYALFGGRRQPRRCDFHKDACGRWCPDRLVDGVTTGVPGGDLDHCVCVSIEHCRRPCFPWPAFIIPAYEWRFCVAGFFGGSRMIRPGLPQLYHPVFNAPTFGLALRR